jgi:hypothetical protein
LLQRLFPDFVPRHIYEVAYVTKSIQLRVSLRFSASRYGFYCAIWDKKGHQELPETVPERLKEPLSLLDP